MTAPVHQQLGEIVATMRGLRDDLAEMKQAHRDSVAERRRENHDLRGTQNALTLRFELFEQRCASQHETNVARLDALAGDLAEMKEPVASYVSVKKRAAGMVVLGMSVISVLWVLAEPVYKFVVERLITRP